MRRLLRWPVRIAVTLLALAIVYVAASVAWVSRHESAVAAATAPAQGRFTDVGGVQVFSQDFGPANGVPILLVHGTAAWSGTWFELVPVLENAGWRVIAVDLPPFGYSDKRAGIDFSRPAQARRLLAVLDAWKVDRAFVVGHSFGGGPALEFALSDPGRVRELVLVDAALGLQAPPPDPASATCRIFGTPALRDIVMASTAGNPLWSTKLLKGFVARKEAVTPERMVQYRRPAALRGANAALGAWANHFACQRESGLSTQPDAIRKLDVPTSLIWGAEDSITPLEQARHLQTLLPNAKLHVVDGVGHIPHIEDPATFARTLLDVLATPPVPDLPPSR